MCVVLVEAVRYTCVLIYACMSLPEAKDVVTVSIS